MEISLRRPTTFRLKTDLLNRLKKAAQKENCSLNNYVESVLSDVVYNTPNSVTRAAIESVNRGEYVGEVDLSSIDAMIKSIEG